MWAIMLADKIAAGFAAMQAVPVITADEFQAMSSQDDSSLIVVLDVRSQDEYQLG